MWPNRELLYFSTVVIMFFSVVVSRTEKLYHTPRKRQPLFLKKIKKKFRPGGKEEPPGRNGTQGTDVYIKRLGYPPPRGLDDLQKKL